jgi:hypothetical protein
MPLRIEAVGKTLEEIEGSLVEIVHDRNIATVCDGVTRSVVTGQQLGMLTGATTRLGTVSPADK